MDLNEPALLVSLVGTRIHLKSFLIPFGIPAMNNGTILCGFIHHQHIYMSGMTKWMDQTIREEFLCQKYKEGHLR